MNMILLNLVTVAFLVLTVLGLRHGMVRDCYWAYVAGLIFGALFLVGNLGAVVGVAPDAGAAARAVVATRVVVEMLGTIALAFFVMSAGDVERDSWTKRGGKTPPKIHAA